jgi:glutamate synthase domain-containing protein 1
MCRVGALKSKKYTHPSKVLYLMLPQQKGHDNSGFAMVMQDLGGVFAPYKKLPLLSYAGNSASVEKIHNYMQNKGFTLRFEWSPRRTPQAGLDIALLEHYNFEVYDYPAAYQEAEPSAKENLLTDTRLALRALTAENDGAFVYSFWPDVLTLKEIGNPADIGVYFNLWQEDTDFCAKIITVQCRQNTNYAIVRYAAHPFFLQGYTVLANGENTFYVKNKEFQSSLHRGYIGFESDSQCFLYTLHYLQRELKWPLEYYKHVITPLPFQDLLRREDKNVLLALRQSLPHLEINGPNTIIGVLPDGRVINVNDSKKLRPIVVGSDGDTVALSSEVCGLNVVLPDRDQEKDIYPNERETIVVDNNLEVTRWKQ